MSVCVGLSGDIPVLHLQTHTCDYMLRYSLCPAISRSYTCAHVGQGTFMQDTRARGPASSVPMADFYSLYHPPCILISLRVFVKSVACVCVLAYIKRNVAEKCRGRGPNRK